MKIRLPSEPDSFMLSGYVCRLLEHANRPLTVEEIAETMNQSVSRIRPLVNELYKDGLVQRSGSGTVKSPYRYTLKPGTNLEPIVEVLRGEPVSIEYPPNQFEIEIIRPQPDSTRRRAEDYVLQNYNDADAAETTLQEMLAVEVEWGQISQERVDEVFEVWQLAKQLNFPNVVMYNKKIIRNYYKDWAKWLMQQARTKKAKLLKQVAQVLREQLT